jgi:two-component system chemotaxis sensor kinase CheA
MMDGSRYAELFRSEAREHLGTITRLLLVLEREPGRAIVLDELFRAVHSLKGAAAAMGYSVASGVAHGLEDLLDGLRRGAVRPDAAVVDLLLQGADALERAIEQPDEPAPRAILDRLATYAGSGAAPRPRPVPRATEPVTEAGAGGWRVRVRFDPAAALPAVRATMALRAARGLGEVVGVDPPEERVLAGELEGELRFRVLGPVEAERLEAAMRGVGEVQSVEVEAEPAEAEPEVESVDAPRGAGGGAGEGPIVRVPQVRLDSVVDEMGELMIARDRLRRVVGAGGSGTAPELEDALETVSRLVDGLREEIMRLRMVPIGDVFDRFPRMVRDAARSLGRRVELRIGGRDEEVDRGLLNEVSDLLVHLLRNAVDHGIEPPDERRAAGKPETGVIRLSAAREGPMVRIEVAADGRGLQRERILATATARGLVAGGGSEMEDADLWGLVTAPGFSTSDRVTDVSGRGVGLDVVRSRAQALGGSLEIRSEAGQGASFSLRLPLSLTLIRALRFEAGGAVYSVPLSAVQEVAEVEEAGEDRVLVRGAPLPVVDLHRILADDGAADRGMEAAVVVVEVGGARAGMIVAGVEGQHQAVVKRFDAPTPMLDLFSGATILPEGRPSLIVDPARLIAMARGGARGSAGIEHAESTES